MSKHAPAASRRWLAALILAVVGLAVVGAASLGWRYARESPPHQGPILLISVSGLSTERSSPYGAARDDTPAINALVKDGVVFERAYTHSPQTLPAHASLFSGQLPFEHHVRDDAGFTLATSTRTLAELLRNRGFDTGAAVSSFLLRPDAGTAQGFSFYDSLAPQPPGDQAVVERDGLSTLTVAEGWIDARKGQRFFLFVQVDQRDVETAVERLIQQLKERRLYDQATILLVGAHGSGESAMPSLDDASLHVPLVVKQPDGAGSGGRVTSVVQHIDLLPTILDFVRAPIPSGLRGRSLRGMLEGNEDEWTDRSIYSESLDAHFRFGGQPVFGLTTDKYRYVRGHGEAIVALNGANVGITASGPEPPESERLRAALEALLRDRVIDAPSPVTAAEEERFAALGHLPGARLAADDTVALNESQEAELIQEHQAAARLVGTRRYAAAADALRRLAHRYPMLAVLHFQLGSLLLETGRLEEAVAAFGTAATLAPDSPIVPAALAGAFLRRQELDLARDEAQRALALAAPTPGGGAPSDRYDAKTRARAHEVAVAVALARREPELATLHAEEAQKADPTLPLTQFVRGRLLYDEGQYADALPVLQEAEAVLKEHGGALQNLHYYMADTLARLDRYEEAEAELRAEQRAFPSGIRSYSSLAMLYRASGRDSDLEQVIRDLMEAVPTPEGYATAAQLWTILGEQSRAEAVRSDARSRFRGDPSLALLERRRGR